MFQPDRPPITVIKNNHAGREVWRYQGVVLERTPSSVTLEAYFNRDDRDDGYMVFRRGDRFVEHFFSNRWYNIFELYDVDDGRLKGWYCNIARPAELGAEVIRQDDLELDLFVYPDGTLLELDRTEFDALPLSDRDRAAALAALQELRQGATAGQPPFERDRQGGQHAAGQTTAQTPPESSM